MTYAGPPKQARWSSKVIKIDVNSLISLFSDVFQSILPTFLTTSIYTEYYITLVHKKIVAILVDPVRNNEFNISLH